MSKRRSYRSLIAGAACNLDVPRTPFAAMKELRPLQRRLITRAGKQFVVMLVSGGEALAIVANQRSWPLNDGRLPAVSTERRRDAAFAQAVARTAL